MGCWKVLVKLLLLFGLRVVLVLPQNLYLLLPQLLFVESFLLR